MNTDENLNKKRKCSIFRFSSPIIEIQHINNKFSNKETTKTGELTIKFKENEYVVVLYDWSETIKKN